MRHFRFGRRFVVVAIAALALAGAATAAICVDGSSRGWTQDDTRPGGSVRFTNDYGAPPGLGRGSLELKTQFANTGAKAGLYNHQMAGFPVRWVRELSYWTYQAVTTPPNPPIAAASYQFQVDVNGSAEGGFTTLVFEPYQNTQQGPLVPATWQRWDVDAGFLWSSRTVSDGVTCNLVQGAGGPPFYTLAQVQAMCPRAVVVGVGVNVGSNNPGWTVATDGVSFNRIQWDFEVRCGDGDDDDDDEDDDDECEDGDGDDDEDDEDDD